MNESVLVSAALARTPARGGHAWFVLQYLLGFRRLSFDVTFVDLIRRDEAVDTGYVADVMRSFGLSGDFAVLDEHGRSVCGLSRERLLERASRSLFLLNVMGYLDDEDVLAAVQRRVFLDIDPGYPQLWKELGLADLFIGHDDFATIALNIGEVDCNIPTCGLDWIRTTQPVVLDEWPVCRGGNAFTTVATWRGPYGVLEYGGAVYGSKVHEFRKIIELPRLVRSRFELALDIHPKERSDLRLLEQAGWSLRDPAAVAASPASYRSFVQRSLAELSVAKPLYVETRSGWFSDRSICYLASGKPVVTQDTGFGARLPTGDGLLAFTTVDEAAAAVEDVERNAAHHAAAARAVAEECFDSDRVLEVLVDQVAIA
jgi:hypothetical protein